MRNGNAKVTVHKKRSVSAAASGWSCIARVNQWLPTRANPTANSFKLSETQADDILDIRLRQLARLEAIKIEQELKGLREDQGELEDILGSAAVLKRTVIKEIEADAKQFGDGRRTVLLADKRAVAEVKVIDEPVTVVVSLKGWVRALKGHEVEVATLAFKAGDALYGAFPCRSVDTMVVIGSNGRVYSVATAGLPGGRGDGVPVTSLIDLEPGTQPAHYLAGASETLLLLVLGLGRYAEAYISDLSTGTRRIVELAGLLALDARLLCMDEPTAGLAQRETEAAGPLIQEISRELHASVLVIEHDMPLIMGISDRVYCLDLGRVIAEGMPSEVRNNPAVIASYLGTDERAIERSGPVTAHA